MDAETALTVTGGAIASKEIIGKILGPTAEYMGVGIKNWTDRAAQNVGKVFGVAKRRLGRKVNEPGSVPPRVLKEVLTEGPFMENEVMTEYFGGVLASSRTTLGHDDRGAVFAARISRLSAYQVRAHFAFYEIIRRLFHQTTHALTLEHGREQMQIFVPFGAFNAAMEVNEDSGNESLVAHIVAGLQAEGLISPNYVWGDEHHLKTRVFPPQKAVFSSNPVPWAPSCSSGATAWATDPSHPSYTSNMNSSTARFSSYSETAYGLHTRMGPDSTTCSNLPPHNLLRRSWSG